jgi:axial budding pattern protein 2
MNGTVASLPIPITVSSTNASSTLYLETWVSLDAIPYFFTTFSLPNATLNPGSFYEFDLTPFVADPDATLNVTVNPLEAAQWLSFHSNKTLSGLAPKNLEYPNVDVVFQASKANLVASNNLLISMNGVTTQGGTNGTAPVPNVSTGGGLSQGAKIGLGVGLGLLGLLLLLLLLFCCCRRRKRSEKTVNDNDSFVGGSDGDPFRKSGRLETTRNFFPNFYSHTDRREDLTPENVEKPTRMDGLRSIFGMSADMSNTKEIKPGDIFTPQLTQSSSSFIAHGDVIGVADPIRSPSRASSFTESMGSSDSRASWESRESFNWSSGENDMPPLTHSKRSSNAPSIPRPRQDFTPRYPRNNSPTRLAALGASQHSLGSPPQGGSSSEGEEHSGIFSSGTLSTDSRFASGPNGLSRFGGSGFKSIDEEDEDSASAEGPAIVAMAERQSLETRRPTERPTPRLRPSKEKITSATDQVDASSSRHALTEMDGEEGMYDDAEEYRRSLMGQYEGDEVHGLGYPASTIYFGTPNPDRSSYNPSEARSSTITAIPPHERVTSPPLPSVGSFKRQSVPPLNIRPSSSSDGRVLACANETFSIHPQIHPPPSVSLSAATWSSAGPSTYRAEVEGGGQLPTWLHFDVRELELWGVPSLNNSGEVTIIKIIEKLPKDKRKSDPTAFGYEPQQERVVGRMVLE